MTEALNEPDPRPASETRLHLASSGPTPCGPASSRPATLREASDVLSIRRRHAKEGPSVAVNLRRRELGKLTARERIEALLDDGSFVELQPFARHRASGFGLEDRRVDTDGVVTGWGTVGGRTVFVFAHDFRILGGTLGEVFAAKVQQLLDLAERTRAPVVGISDGGGARIQEGVDALAGFGGIFLRNVRCSGVIPQISVVLGPCAGGAVYSPALTDFVFVVDGTSNMFITGPEVIEAVTGERVDREALGGANVHSTRTGVASFLAPDERSSLSDVRYLLSFLPSNHEEPPPSYTAADPPDRACDALLDIVPAEPNKSYDVRRVIAEIVDDGEFLEVQEHWARNVVCVLARLDGQTVGVVANQPMVLAGVLDIHASEKAARFVRTCDCFGIPLVTLVDVPGFLPGVDQEHNGIIRHGAKLLFAYCEASVPRIQVILRKAFGGAYIVMDSKSIGSDLSFAWPTNEVAVMGAEAAARIIFRRELAAARDPKRRHAELMADYTGRLMNPWVAAERGLVDDVINPADSRRVLIRSLAALRSKRPGRRHGNMPL